MLWFLFWTYLFYFIPAATGVALLWRLAGKQKEWSFWELHLLVVPYLVWLLLWLMDNSPKDLGNVIEPALLGAELIFLADLRLTMIRRIGPVKARMGMLAILILSAVLIYLLVPHAGGALWEPL